MKMSRCVPSWDHHDNPTQLSLMRPNSLAADLPSLDCEVAEVRWEKKDQLAMYGGLGPPLVLNKPAAAVGNKLVPWLDHRDAAFINPALDALVPCKNRKHDTQENSGHVPGGTAMVGSCSGGGGLDRARSGCCRSYASAGESATCGGGDSRQVSLDSSDREFGGSGITPTSLWSPENTSSGEDYTKASFEEDDSVFRSRCRSQRQAGDKLCNRKGIGISAKSRAAAVHKQCERRRRDKINQRMKTLQKLVPNSSKSDKASMLDEVIEYLKQLQAQVHMMSRMNMMMMMPLPMMSIIPPTMGMGMGVMDINAMGGAAALLPMMPSPPANRAAAFTPFPSPSWDVHADDSLRFPPEFLSPFFACQAQTQAMTVDAYSRMAALYQQLLQSSTGSKN